VAVFSFAMHPAPAVDTSLPGRNHELSPQLRNDVFISYSHFDNAPLFEEKGWIEILHRDLEVRLRQLLGEELSVWRDPKLTGNEYFEDSLRNRLLKTALLLSVVSPRYVKSESCIKEVEAFCAGATESAGLRLQDKARLLRVEKTRVPREQMPQPAPPWLRVLRDRQGQGPPREFLSPTRGDESYQACLEEFEDLAYDIKLTLEALRSFETQRKGEDVDAARVVYVADTVSELRAQGDQLRRELRQRGYVVYPCEAAPENGERYRAFVADAMRKAGLSVHLLGSLYGVTLEGETRSTIEVQIEEAGRRERRAAPRALAARSLAAGRRTAARLHRYAPARRGESAEHRAHADQHREPQDLSVAQADGVREAGDNAKPAQRCRSSISFTTGATARVLPLRDALMAGGYEVKPSYFEGDETELREYHQDNLVDCDGVIIYYGARMSCGSSASSPICARLSAGRTRPYRAKAIIVGVGAAEGTAAYAGSRGHRCAAGLLRADPSSWSNGRRARARRAARAHQPRRVARRVSSDAGPRPPTCDEALRRESTW
jgi:hypothetical protein